MNTDRETLLSSTPNWQRKRFSVRRAVAWRAGGPPERRHAMPPRRPEAADSGSRWVGAAVSLLFTAVVGYFFNLAQEIHKRRLDFVDAQLEHLYGPLLAQSSANSRAWEAIRVQSSRNATYYFNDADPPTVAQVRIWRQWMNTVFMPSNEKMVDAITMNAHLLRGEKMYPVFQDFLRHVAGYRGLMANWKSGDPEDEKTFTSSAVNVSVNEYPRTLNSCIENEFLALRKLQNRLRGSPLGLGGLLDRDSETVDPDCFCSISGAAGSSSCMKLGHK
jgi:hypothetical protein